MVDEIYKNSFKEVYEILKNTDEELVNKIPNKFMEFIKNNMNSDYVINIRKDIEIDKQKILPETEGILALIYRSYWATEEERQQFKNKERQEFLNEEKRKQEKYEGKNIDEIFEKRKDFSSVILDSNLMIIKEESFIKKILNKIKNMFRFKF